VLRHQFGQNLVLGLDLPGQILDAFLLGLRVGASLRLKSGGAVLEELLLPKARGGEALSGDQVRSELNCALCK